MAGQYYNSVTLKKALDVLVDPELKSVVDMVCFKADEDSFKVANAEGYVVFRQMIKKEGNYYEIIEADGKNPIERQDPKHLGDLSTQLNNKYPTNAENSYPFAFQQLAQIWDHPNAPDLIAIHSAAHNWIEDGGHLGEHGSLGVVQSRAPLLIGGKGIKKQGWIDGSCRLIDVAPTIMEVLGGQKIPNEGKDFSKYLSLQEGQALSYLLEPREIPRVVVGILLDGTNSAVFYDLIKRGQLESFGYVFSNGAALSFGALAGFPSVTLPNHTSIMTGALPGHHNILHNAWYDKANEVQIVTESPTTWHLAMNWLNPKAETIWQALARNFENDLFVCIDEPADKGASYSTFDLFRNKRIHEIMPDMSKMPANTNEEFFNSCNNYKIGSFADELGLNQAISILKGSFLGESFSLPKLLWYSMTVTDAAFHEGGPYSDIAKAALIDSDKRFSMLLSVLDEKRLLQDTMFVVVADHGMEESNIEIKGNWDKKLEQEGLSFRDESYGFLYLLDE